MRNTAIIGKVAAMKFCYGDNNCLFFIEEDDTDVTNHDTTESEGQAFVPVFFAENDIEAEIVKGILMEAGIPVVERGDMEDDIYPVSIGPLAEETLYVPESRAEEAQALISDSIEKGKQLPEDTE
jgi:hypothetical protein